MDFDWKTAVKTVAPWIGTAIGGPVGGMAAKALSSVLLGKEDASEDEISAAMCGATHEQLLALKQAENDFKVSCRELGLKKLSALVSDKNSSRKMQMATKSKTPAILAYLLTAMVAGMIYALVMLTIPSANKDIINIVFGSVMTAWIGAMQFYHGATIKEDE